MLDLSMFNKRFMCRVQSVWISLGMMLLAGCSSPSFVNPPPETYHVPASKAINGVWANEYDNGERVRLSVQKNGTLHLSFFKTQPSSDSAPVAPLILQTLRIDDADWVLLDFRKLAAWQGEQYTEQAPFRLLKYVLETPDRLCAIEMNVGVFAEAIKSGQLAGAVDSGNPSSISVTVNSPGADWIKWWLALPASQKTFSSATFCYQRVKQK